VLTGARAGTLNVRTSTRASSTGYPFKVADIVGTLSDEQVYADRHRICDLGYLREAYMKDDGAVGYRCPSEPVDIYVSKGGEREDTIERTCLCNALMATAGFAQIRKKGDEEPSIVTSGDCINELAPLVAQRESYGALDVIAFLEPGVHAKDRVTAQ
jgi:nitronate monooxygenase